MPNILAIDTATDACSVARSKSGVISGRSELIPRQHSQRLFPMLREVVGSGRLQEHDIDLLAWSHGPGSFTGLRIAASAVQGLAYTNQLPVTGISTLACMALGAARQLALNDSAVILPLLDARINEIYWGLYRFQDDCVQALHDDSVCAPGQFPGAALQGHSKIVVVGSGLRYLDDMPAAIRPLLSQQVEQLWPDARDLISLAQRAHAEGCVQSAQDVQPVYIRNEIGWKKLSQQG